MRLSPFKTLETKRKKNEAFWSPKEEKKMEKGVITHAADNSNYERAARGGCMLARRVAEEGSLRSKTKGKISHISQVLSMGDQLREVTGTRPKGRSPRRTNPQREGKKKIKGASDELFDILH